MIWLDIVIIIILALLCLHGFVIGLIRSAFDILGIVLGYVLAIGFSGSFGLPRFISLLIIFVIVVVGVHLVGRVISKLIRATPLGSIDRLLGAVLGLVKGFIICFVIILALMLIQKSNKTVARADIAPWILKTGVKMTRVLPEKLHRWIDNIATHKGIVQKHGNYNFSL